MLFFNDLMILSVFKLKDVGGKKKKKAINKKSSGKVCPFSQLFAKN